MNYTLSPTTFVEATYGFIRNELTGGNEGGVLVNEAANRLNALPGFPLIFPNAGKVNNDGYYANEVLDYVGPPLWDAQNRMMNLPPIFGWGNRIGAAPPNQRYPGWLNINRTQDVAVSLTKVMGRHTLKAGFYNNHSFKAQNVGAGGGIASRAMSTSATTPTTRSTPASATPTRHRRVHASISRRRTSSKAR